MKEQNEAYVVVPISVLTDEKLGAGAKLLYGDIRAFCTKNGLCWASNNYLAKRHGTTERTIRRWLKELEDSEYIKRGGRYISLDNEQNGADKNVQNSDKNVQVNEFIADKNVQELAKNVQNSDKNVQELAKNVTHNNKNIILKLNNKTNNNVRKGTHANAIDFIISEYTDNKALQEILVEFVKMRKSMKKPLSEYALKLTLKKLDEIGKTDSEKIKIINNSVMNNWQGIFELNNYQQNGYIASRVSTGSFEQLGKPNSIIKEIRTADELNAILFGD